MEEQETLFGVEIGKKDYSEMSTLEKMKAHNKRISKNKQKGIISIHLCNNGFAVDFDGHGEGCGCPCKDEESVNKEVARLQDYYKEKYSLLIIDERKGEQIEKDAEEKVKFPNQEGDFFLNNVKVHFKFQGDYSGMPHYEFTTENKENCLLTDTGYRSDFVDFWCVNQFETIKESVRYEVEHIINCDDTGKKKKKLISYNLIFEDEKEKFELNITDYYFFDMRMWEKPFDLENEITEILERNHTNNSGNGCYQIRQLNDKVKALEYLKPKMIIGISNMCASWKKELTGNYLKTYGEIYFKENYESYKQLSDWLSENSQRAKTESYEFFLDKAKKEMQEKEDEEIKKLAEPLKELLQKKYGYPIKLEVIRATSVALGDELK